MSPTVTDLNLAPGKEGYPGRWWHLREDGRIVCDLCPRYCALKDGDRGFCFVRQNIAGQMVLTTYGRSTGFCVDPIEKKPLNHFYPGTSVLSFGTAGCNLACKYCQNWSISKSRQFEQLSEGALPWEIAEAAVKLGCQSVAFTYNDPVIWAEYAIDTARACHECGIKTVAKTSGYITAEARKDFFSVMDAANVDLKAFTERFYRHLTLTHLQPVLDTLSWLTKETQVWLEITNLIIPEENDSSSEIQQMCEWILQNLGDEVPVHFTAFHPDYLLRHRPPTSLATLTRARSIAQRTGLKFVYTGNIYDPEGQSTYCPECGKKVIDRQGYEIGAYHLKGNRCEACGRPLPGCFAEVPGTWGQRRIPVNIRSIRT
jgi:AmmeMemoRadiSam system radical SAM enzyme